MPNKFATNVIRNCNLTAVPKYGLAYFVVLPWLLWRNKCWTWALMFDHEFKSPYWIIYLAFIYTSNAWLNNKIKSSCHFPIMVQRFLCCILSLALFASLSLMFCVFQCCTAYKSSVILKGLKTILLEEMYYREVIH